MEESAEMPDFKPDETQPIKPISQEHLETAERPKVFDAKAEILTAPGAEFIEPEDYDIPQEIPTPNTIPTEEKHMFQKAVVAYKRYLETPIIRDNFPKHEERAKWRKEKALEIKGKHGTDAMMQFDEMQTNNRLSGNSLNVIDNYNQLFADYLPQEQTDKISNLIKDNLKTQDAEGRGNWETLSADKKIEVVSEISDSIASMLKEMAEPVREPAAAAD